MALYDFKSSKGVELLRNPWFLAAFLVMMLVITWAISFFGFIAAVPIVLFPFVVGYIWLILENPRIGFAVLFVYNFIALGLTRYVPGIPFGIGVDVQLVLIYISLIINSFFNKISWGRISKDLLFLAVVWYAYTLFQLVNPEAVSRVAWFYAMRGVSLYMLLTIPLVFILFNKEKDLYLFLKIWAVLAIMGSVKGIMQKFLGPDPWEQAWLDSGGSLTHEIFGKLRVFSFFSDAGQFGGAQGHSAIVFLILAYHEKYRKKIRTLFLLAGLFSLYGMMISGTRGAIAVPVAGFALYIILRKKFKLVVLGVLAFISLFIFFRYTSIGNSSYTIYRMRSAFNLNDPSFQVRLANQKKLKTYMADRPFGGGIGSAGNWGMRFSPNTFLAQTPTDSWYVMIWAEQGIIGLLLHLSILFYIVVKSSIVIMYKLKDPANRVRMSALLSGVWGVMIASYTNGVFGQMPTGIIIYISMAYLFISPSMDRELLAA